MIIFISNQSADCFRDESIIQRNCVPRATWCKWHVMSVCSHKPFLLTEMCSALMYFVHMMAALGSLFFVFLRFKTTFHHWSTLPTPLTLICYPKPLYLSRFGRGSAELWTTVRSISWACYLACLFHFCHCLDFMSQILWGHICSLLHCSV